MKAMLGCVVLVMFGCSGDDGGGGGGGGPTEPNGDLAGAATARWARYANLSPTVGAIDICFETMAGSGVYEGPVFAAAGLTGGLQVGDVSAYVPVPVSTVMNRGARRVVAGGSGSCATAHPMIVDGVAYDMNRPDGSHVTYTFYDNMAGVPQSGGGSTDLHDLMNPNPGPMLLRNMADGFGMVDIGVMDGGAFVQLKGAVGVESLGGFTSSNASSLANGWFAYLRGPVMGATIAVRPTGTTASAPVAMVDGVDLVVGKAWTVFLAGHMGSASDPLKLIACDDYFRRGALSACLE